MKANPSTALTTFLRWMGKLLTTAIESLADTLCFCRGEVVVEFKKFHLLGVNLGQNADCLSTDHVVVEQKIRNLGWRQVRRYCGDWDSQLKAIHVVTQVSGLRIGAFLAPMHENEHRPRGFVAKVCMCYALAVTLFWQCN